MKIESRTRGKTDVYRGPPCPNGHDGIRYKSTGQCVECKRESGRKAAVPRSTLSEAVRKQSRWVAAFEKNFSAVSKLGLVRVLSPEYHRTPLQGWVYRMRTRWSDHPPERQQRLLSLGQKGWWLGTDVPRHQMRSGVQVGTTEHKAHKATVLKAWRQRNETKLRDDQRERYKNNPEQRRKATAKRAARFKENPGLAAYLTSLRRKREQSQRCDCCTNKEFRAVYLANAELGLETDHKVSLAIANEQGLKGKHCVKNLRGLTPTEHKAKTSRDISELAAIRRAKKLPYHKSRRGSGTFAIS